MSTAPSKTYTLTIRFTFPAPDDIGAKMVARGIRNAIVGALTVSKSSVTMKLQEIFSDKAPRKVNYDPQLG